MMGLLGVKPVLPTLPINYLIQDKQLVLRIQNKAQQGPYRGTASFATHPRGGELDAMLHRHDSPTTHPAVYKDKGFGGIHEWDIKIPNFRFGFSSVEQMLDWFSPGELDTLEALGFTLSVYLIPFHGVLSGDSQCVFDPKSGSVLMTLKPTIPEPELRNILRGLLYGH